MSRKGYQRSRSGSSGRLRIVGGRHRGRVVHFRGGGGLRPTPERTRETVFNWLQGRLPGARVLDLFAGSGALGLEALSRGAAAVELVERDPRAAASLRATLNTLDAVRNATPAAGTEMAPAATVRQAEAVRWLTERTAAYAWDVVFLDPPFGEAGMIERVLPILAARGHLARDARVFCEYDPHRAPAWLGNWTVLRETRAGDSSGALLAPRSTRG